MLVLTNYGIVYFKSSCSICHFIVIIKLVLVPGQQARGETRAVTNPKKNSDPDPNPNEVSCRISDPDPIIHKIYIKHNKTC